MSGRVGRALRAELYTGPLAGADGLAAQRLVAPLAEGLEDDPLAATLHIDGQLALVDDMLHYFDRASMTHSLEVRVPFLDHEVVEYCARIPTRSRCTAWTKYLLKRAARGLVPAPSSTSASSASSSGSTDGWLQAQMERRDHRLPAGAEPALRRVPRPRRRRAARRAHIATAAGRDVQLLLGVLMLEIWLPRTSRAPRRHRAPARGGLSGSATRSSRPSERGGESPAPGGALEARRSSGGVGDRRQRLDRRFAGRAQSSPTARVGTTTASRRRERGRAGRPRRARLLARGRGVARRPAGGRRQARRRPRFEADYFERLLAAFEANPRLGIASGICLRAGRRAWRPAFGTRAHVWGASRAYRRECLAEVLPLEERQGWDEIDAIKARLHGWEVEPARPSLPAPAPRGSARRRSEAAGPTRVTRPVTWATASHTCWSRAVFRARRDPAALAMVPGYLRAALRRAPQLPDTAARAYVRRAQRLRELPLRAREARGKLSAETVAAWGLRLAVLLGLGVAVGQLLAYELGLSTRLLDSSTDASLAGVLSALMLGAATLAAWAVALHVRGARTLFVAVAFTLILVVELSDPPHRVPLTAPVGAAAIVLLWRLAAEDEVAGPLLRAGCFVLAVAFVAHAFGSWLCRPVRPGTNLGALPAEGRRQARRRACRLDATGVGPRGVRLGAPLQARGPRAGSASRRPRAQLPRCGRAPR